MKGLIGDEGMWSVDVPLGTNTSNLRVAVQGGGAALRMKSERFRKEVESSGALRRLINNYTAVILRQYAQASVCMSFHVVEARLARWLLMTQDRAHADQLHLTHEYLASMLGVRRVGVTIAASSLQRKKLIAYNRGHITIRNRPGLEIAACGCYAEDKRSYAETEGERRGIGHKPSIL